MAIILENGSPLGASVLQGGGEWGDYHKSEQLVDKSMPRRASVQPRTDRRNRPLFLKCGNCQHLVTPSG